MTRLLACVFVLATATGAAAQSKFSGKCSQPQPDPNYAIPVGDEPNHVMTLSKAKARGRPGNWPALR